MGETNQQLRIDRITKVNESLIEGLTQVFNLEWDQDQGLLFINNPDNALFLAFWNEKLAGFLSAYRLQRFDKKRADVLLYEIEVVEEFRQKGIGKALIEEVKKWAKEAEAEEVWVLTYSSNIPAMAMYRSAGGEEDEPGTRMFTYKI